MPGVRRRLSEAERRTQIIEATLQVVAEIGVANASLALIAERADVSKGLVSHYFGDRVQLMRQTVLETASTIREHLTATIDTTAPVPQVIREAMRAMAAMTRTHPTQLRALDEIVRNLRTSSGEPAFRYADYEAAYRDQGHLVERGVREGTLRRVDPRTFATAYQGLIDTMIGHLAEQPDADPERFADRYADLLLEGVLTR